MHKELYDFGNFRLDVGERRLERLNRDPANGPLREKPFEVLVYLVRNSGRLVTKDELISAAWPDAIVEEANLSKAVHAIRQFLGESTSDQKYIETVPKHGYRFVADVRRVESTANGVGYVAVGTNEFIGLPEESNTNVSAESTSEPGAIDPLLEKTATPGPRHSNPKVFRYAVFVLIGVLAVGGLFVTNNWRQSGTAPQNPVSSDTANSSAYDLYVRGKVKAGIENPEETDAAIRLLEEAVMLDPHLAEAYPHLARAYNTKAFKYSSHSERTLFYENAEIAIEKALALKPDLAAAHYARGLILWNNTKGFPHEQAIRSYKRSLELDPGQDEVHHQLSMVYAHIGLFDEAQRSLDKTLELNPNNTMARFRVGNYLAWQGKFNEALAVLKTVPSDVSPVLVERIKAEALIQAGRIGEAQTIVENYLTRFPNDDGGSFTSVKALLLAKSGKREEAEDTINRAAEIGKGFGHYHHTAYNIASAYVALNEPDEAVKWLEVTADDGFPCYSYFNSDPNLEKLRGHPRFTELMLTLQRQWKRFKELG